MPSDVRSFLGTLGFLVYCLVAGGLLFVLLAAWFFFQSFGYPWPGEVLRIYGSAGPVERRACVVREGWGIWIGATRSSSLALDLASSVAVDYEDDPGSGMSPGSVAGGLTPEVRDLARDLLEERCSLLERWLYLRGPREDWEPFRWLRAGRRPRPVESPHRSGVE